MRRLRTTELVERRLSLVRLIIALFVARIVVTIAEITEERVSAFTALVTAAIGVEAWRAWSVARTARAAADEPAALPDTRWDRLLRPAERRGPALLYALAAAFALTYIAFKVFDGNAETLLDVTVIVREVTTFLFLGVLLAGYMSVRATR